MFFKIKKKFGQQSCISSTPTYGLRQISSATKHRRISHRCIDCFTFLSINIITQDCRKQPIDKATLGNRDGWRQIFTRSILKFDKCAGKRKENWTTTENRDDANGNYCPALYLCESHKLKRHTTQFMTLLKRFVSISSSLRLNIENIPHSLWR